MKHKFWLLLLSVLMLSSCITSKEVQYLQPSESLVVNEEGLVPYSNREYRITKDDIFNLNIITTPKGDAAQFYSSYNSSGSVLPEAKGDINNWNQQRQIGGIQQGGNQQNLTVGNPSFFFNGIKVDGQGDVFILGIGNIHAEGRTLAEVNAEIQARVNENFLEGKAEARLNLDGIRYYVIGDIETVGITGEKTSYTSNLSIMEAIAQNGGLNRTVDRSNVVIRRKYPEGIKKAVLDLTREDAQNSPYFWVQNGDMIYLNTRNKSIYGFGKEPIQNVTTTISALSTLLSIYLILTRL